MMTYTEALEYIHGISWTFCKPGLERIRELCDRLGNPEKELKFIHVAGTNGKGSTSSMLSEVLCKAGYRTGLYTSPYIRRFNERMRVNGKDISDGTLAEITEYVRPIADSMTDKPTEFELITAIAFEFFKHERCEVVVLEAGMGGRLDSTNIIRNPLLSIITGIALDHTAFLGDTVEKIAREKAGIIKDTSPVLYGGRDEAAYCVIKEVAEERGSSIARLAHGRISVERTDLSGTEFSYKDRCGLKIKLLGLYQPSNASLVCEAVDILRERGLKIPEDALYEGLLSARWPARFEVISKEPTVIFDGAHNPEGIAAAVESISRYFDRKICVLSGVLRDKDYVTIAKDISRVAERAFTVTPDNPRALTAEEYAEVLRTEGVEATATGGTRDAFRLGMKYAEEHRTALCCLGSLYTYGEVISSLEELNATK
ncbi:MAG: bifunctional folylpolyglutamate synthase/dihydrofolate synthase [Clostridia bacterium]|nr:bifunctional folylpolyglutamate synthase/dihydrofolate synthase [Clostridia bacterium]